LSQQQSTHTDTPTHIHTSAIETTANLVRSTTFVKVWLDTQHTITINLQRTQHRLICLRRRPALVYIYITFKNLNMQKTLNYSNM